MSEPLRTAPNIPECSCDRNDDSWVGEPGPMPLCSYHERWRRLSWESLMCVVIDFEAALAASPSRGLRAALLDCVALLPADRYELLRPSTRATVANLAASPSSDTRPRLREALEAMTQRKQRPAGRGEYIEHVMDDGHGPDGPCAICAFLASPGETS